MSFPLTIRSFSTALFSTWCFIEELGILFDCGDGACAGLLQKARKVRHCFITHADRDHLAGLLQFQQLNGRDGLQIHFPADCGSFPAIAEFVAKFDPHISGTRWNEIRELERIRVKKDIFVRALANEHVPGAENQVKSLSYFVEHEVRKLKKELQGKTGSEIAELRKDRGDAFISDVQVKKLFCFSGDTPVADDGRYSHCEVLFHEATFLSRDALEESGSERNLHSSLDAVMEMVRDSEAIGRLILGHFSSRYSAEEIQAAVVNEKKRCGLDLQIDLVLPGRTSLVQIS